MSDLTQNYRITKGIPWQTLDGAVILLAPQKKLAHELDEIGTLIWQAISNKVMTQDILNDITATYDVEPEIAHSDLQEFISHLQSENLIENN